VYAAAALAEWTLQRDANVARKIFEKGARLPACLPACLPD
jgi:hypothetical protein